MQGRVLAWPPKLICNMNWLDIVILCLIVAGLVKGLSDGMVKQLVAIIALIIGVYLCSGVANWLYNFLVQLGWFPPRAVLLTSYFLGFVLIVGIILLAGNIIHRLIDATPLSIFNHLIGGFIGVVLMILFVSLLFNLIEIFDHQSVLLSQKIKVESRFYLVIKTIIPSFFPGNLFELNHAMLT